VALDINTPEGHATAVELIGACDVMLENFRPGLMSKLGLRPVFNCEQERYARLVKKADIKLD
jgi:hypothetical protein